MFAGRRVCWPLTAPSCDDRFVATRLLKWCLVRARDTQRLFALTAVPFVPFPKDTKADDKPPTFLILVIIIWRGHASVAAPPRQYKSSGGANAGELIAGTTTVTLRHHQCLMIIRLLSASWAGVVASELASCASRPGVGPLRQELRRRWRMGLFGADASFDKPLCEA